MGETRADSWREWLGIASGWFALLRITGYALEEFGIGGSTFEAIHAGVGLALVATLLPWLALWAIHLYRDQPARAD